MPTAQERLRDVLKEARELHLKGALTGEDATRFESLVNEAEGLKAQHETNERLNAVNEYATKSAGMLPIAGGEPGAPTGVVTVDPRMAPAGNTVVQRDRKGLEILEQYGEGLPSITALKATRTPEYRSAFREYLRRPKDSLKSGELKILQEGIDTEGGFGVPADLLDRIIAKEPTPTRVAGRVTQLQTSRDKLTVPRVNYTTDDKYTTGMRITWTGEIPASSSTANATDPVFGQTDIPIFTAMMKILLTNDMIEDASFPVVSYITGKFAETVELLRDDMVLNGTGLGQPSGILLSPGGTNQPSVVVSGAASTIGTDGKFLVNLGFALPEQYDDSAAYVFNKTSTGAAIANLQDLEGRFLWGSGLQDSGLSVGWKNRMLLGYPVVLSGFMPSVGSSTYPIIFGDLNGYYLVNRVGFSVQVLREVYAEVNQIAIVGRLRFGGQVVEPWKLKIGQCHT